MHVAAFVAAVAADLDPEIGGIATRGMPMNNCPVPEPLPVTISVPLVLAVWTESGQDHDPIRYILARDPDGVRHRLIEKIWHWPDVDGQPFKFESFVMQAQIPVSRPGIYEVGLFHDPEGTETESYFPLPVTLDAST